MIVRNHSTHKALKTLGVKLGTFGPSRAIKGFDMAAYVIKLAIFLFYTTLRRPSIMDKCSRSKSILFALKDMHYATRLIPIL